MEQRTKFQIIALDFILLSVCYFGAVLFKRGYLLLNKDYEILYGVIIGSLFLSSLTSGKFKLLQPETFLSGLKVIMRSFFHFALILFFGFYFFHLFGYSRFILLVTIGLYLGFEIVFFWLVYFLKLGPNVKLEGSDFEDLGSKVDGAITKQKDVWVDGPDRKVIDPFRDKLKYDYLKDKEKVFQFVDNNIRLEHISASKTFMLNKYSRERVDGIREPNLEFFVNLTKLNELEQINKFLEAVQEKLVWGGYFVGVVETLEQRFQRKFSKFPKLLRGFCYLVDFIWSRVCPKLPVFQRIYFLFKGRDKMVLSQSEALGRLHFCGFNVVKVQEIDNLLYFIGRKVKPVMRVGVKSWGMVFKQKRIGQNGDYINIYKLRSMHPYSEYLYKYVYDKLEMVS